MAACVRRESGAMVERTPAAPSRAALLLIAVVLWVPGECRGAQAESGVRAVTSTNWSALLEGEWMIKFYAPWCPACQQIQSAWESFAERSHALGVKVGKVDVTEEPGLSGRFFVTTLPTIFHAKDGVFRRYHGSRMVEDLQTFISEKKWEVIEPVAGWRSPSSILMSGMASLFQLSGWMRQLHNYFTGPLGIPAWGSYVIFVVATLFIGLLLGLVKHVPISNMACSELNEEDLANVEADPKVLPMEKEADNAANEEGSDNDNEEENGEEISNSSEDDSEKENSNEDDSEDSNEDDDEDVSDGDANNAQNVAKDSDEDSAVAGSEAEEDNITEMAPQSPPESESALRQRRSEATVDNGH
uniref:Thioredoxin-related transmembrane protein 4 n=1 Tax=Xenopus tropicalis TaxID=8364 RepID=A0A6I8PLS2_XENTR